MRPRAEKAAAFRALHERPAPLSSPIRGMPARRSCWLRWASRHWRPPASASPTCSAAPTAVTRDEVIDNCREIAAATDLPVNADLENCFAHEPEAAAETIRLAAEAGAVGGSIEDFTGDAADPIYDFDLAVARVRAAAAGRAQPAGAVPAHGAGGEFDPRAQRHGRHDPPAASL